MSQLQENIHSIITAFYNCSRGEGSCSPLSREELRQLMEQEFEDAMESPQDPTTVTKVLCFLADDSSCRVDFRELLSLVFRVAKACYQPQQQPQALGDAQEPTGQEKAGGKQLLGLSTGERTSHNQQGPEQAVSKQSTETQDPETTAEQDPETPEQDPETAEQDPETAEQDPETPEQDPETAEQDPETAEQDPETAEQDPETAEQDPETAEQDPEHHQSQEGERLEQEQDTQQEDGTEAPEGDPERGEVLDTAAPEQNRAEAEEAETPKQDLKSSEAPGPEAPGEGSDHPEAEPAEQDLSFPSETQDRDPKNKPQVCNGPWQDPNLGDPQELLPQQGPCQEAAFHLLPESKELEQGHGEAEAPPHPAQHQGDAQHQRQPVMEQQQLQPLCQWPPEQ
ncbi:cornulin-like [Indicator indicator]|uniref:cornulin-like n=1 Tax=Indicator indicator TaxID=1002788 RepID=UPI0023DFDBB5|nr:cornulin-like [Indicator indicator]